MPGYYDAIRKYILYVISDTCQKVTKTLLADSLRLDEAKVDALVRHLAGNTVELVLLYLGWAKKTAGKSDAGFSSDKAILPTQPSSVALVFIMCFHVQIQEHSSGPSAWSVSSAKSGQSIVTFPKMCAPALPPAPECRRCLLIHPFLL